MSEQPGRTETSEAARGGFQPPEAGPHQEMAESASAASPAQHHNWWFVELWWESREIFKELVKHILFFGMLIGSLILFHYVLEKSGLPPDQKTALDKVHFWGSVVSLVIFTVSFIIKLTIYEFRGKKHE